MGSVCDGCCDACGRGGNDFYGVDLGVVSSGGEGDGDFAVAVGGRGEGLDYGFVGSAGGGEDVEVGEDSHAIDGDVEETLAGGGPPGFGKVEADGAGGAGGQAGDDVAELLAGALRLIDVGGRRVGDTGGADSVCNRVGGTADEVGVGKEGAGGGSTAGDRDGVDDGGGDRARLDGFGTFAGGVDGGDLIVVRRAVGQADVGEGGSSDAGFVGSRAFGAGGGGAIDVVGGCAGCGVPTQRDLVLPPVATRFVGAAGGAEAGVIWMPSTLALSSAVVKAMVIVPVESAVAAKVWATALLAPPAAVKMSKLVRTGTVLIATLNLRLPAVVHQVSAKSRRTLYAALGVRLGMV